MKKNTFKISAKSQEVTQRLYCTWLLMKGDPVVLCAVKDRG